MKRLKFKQLNNELKLTEPYISNKGFVVVNWLTKENMYIIVKLDNGQIISMKTIENKKTLLTNLKKDLRFIGVNFKDEMRKKI